MNQDDEIKAVKPLPSIRIAHPHVVVSADLLDGSPVVEGSRIPVRRLFGWHRQGTTVETLVRRYPGLGWAKILDALAFAYDNLDLITADLLRDRDGAARNVATSRCLAYPERIDLPAYDCLCERCRALRSAMKSRTSS